MTRDEVVRMIVLMSICDDYEEPVLLHEEMVRTFPELDASPVDIRRSLCELVHIGLAVAYRLSVSPDALRIEGVPTDDDFASGDCYFLATKEGIKVQDECGIEFDEGKLDQRWWAENKKSGLA